MYVCLRLQPTKAGDKVIMSLYVDNLLKGTFNFSSVLRRLPTELIIEEIFMIRFIYVYALFSIHNTSF
jgi:hypothetical protein